RPHGSGESRSAEAWNERLTGRPAAVHSKWDRILARCLDPDPTRRFSDADEVALAFAPSRTRRWLLGAAAAIVLSVASGVVTYQKATAPRESVSLAMLPFESGAGMAPIAEGLLRDTSAQLAGIKSSARTKLRFIPMSNVLRKKVDTAEKARAALGA